MLLMQPVDGSMTIAFSLSGSNDPAAVTICVCLIAKLRLFLSNSCAFLDTPCSLNRMSYSASVGLTCAAGIVAVSYAPKELGDQRH